MTKLEQLKDQRNKLDIEIQEEEERLRQERYNAVTEKLNSLSDEQKKFLLSQLSHDRTSCSDEHPVNGLYSSGNTFRCRKCMLMEIFNGEHGGCYNFKFNVDISEI